MCVCPSEEPAGVWKVTQCLYAQTRATRGHLRPPEATRGPRAFQHVARCCFRWARVHWWCGRRLGALQWRGGRLGALRWRGRRLGAIFTTSFCSFLSLVLQVIVKKLENRDRVFQGMQNPTTQRKSASVSVSSCVITGVAKLTEASPSGPSHTFLAITRQELEALSAKARGRCRWHSEPRGACPTPPLLLPQKWT